MTTAGTRRLARFAIGGTVAAAVAFAGFGAAPAAAGGGGSFPTTIVELNTDCGLEPPNDELCLVSGFIDSPKARCIANRKVKVFRLDAQGDPVLIDIAKTSRAGAFAGLGPPSDVSASKATVLRRTIGSGEDRITCKRVAFVSA